MKYLFIIVLLLPLVFYACGSSFSIKNKPISFSEERIELTKDYLLSHYGIDAWNSYFEPRMIVLHWTAVNSFDSCFNIFNMETLNGSRPDLASSGQLNVSIQFLVDRDGSIYQLMPENKIARHCIGLNYAAIGVENVGGENNIDNLTDEQIDANVMLVGYLKEKYPGIEYLIGHHEYLMFENHPLWLEKDKNYRTVKVDPGSRFMEAVRNKTSNLNLKKPPLTPSDNH